LSEEDKADELREAMRVAVIVLAVVGSIAGCVSRPDVSALIAEPVIATRYDARVDFAAFDTFAVNPTVSVLRDVGDAGRLAPDTTAAVIDRITMNMSARGFRPVDVSDRPDLGLQATVYTQINTVTTGATGSWWGIPGYAGAPAYWGYPGSSYYAPWSYPTNVYKSGTLLIECVDLRAGAGIAGGLDASAATLGADGGDASGGGQLEVVWTAYGHGVADELLTSLSPAGLESIDQAFLQSPYLRHRETNE
jgi:hypothetical protein